MTDRQFMREEAEWRAALRKHYWADDPGGYFSPDLTFPCKATPEDEAMLHAAALRYAPRPPEKTK